MSKLATLAMAVALVISGVAVSDIGSKGALNFGGQAAWARDAAKARETRADKRPANTTEGMVVAVTENSVTVSTGKDAAGKEQTETFPFAAKHKLIANSAAQLVPGDKVTIGWADKGGVKTIRRLSGQGTITGTVTAANEHSIEITPKEGKARKFAPALKTSGKGAAKTSEVDKDIATKMAAQKVGSAVTLTWMLEDGKRVVDIQAAEASPEKKTPAGQ